MQDVPATRGGIACEPGGSTNVKIAQPTLSVLVRSTSEAVIVKAINLLKRA
jgi:hypothetical protein